MQREFVLGPFGGVWQGLEHLEPCGEMPNRFGIGRTLGSTLARLLPIGQGLCHQACLRIVMRQQLGLGLAEVGKAHLQYLRNALMVLLTGAAQQRLIRCVLDQGVLEEVRRLRRQPLLVQQLCLHQLLQPPP